MVPRYRDLMRGGIALWLSVSLVSAWAAAPAAAPLDAHLLRGAQHFRAGRFAAALVEFQVAQRRGGGDEASRYVGAALVKLGRHEEAYEVFHGAARPGDDLMTWYAAMACHGARLYGCAERLLAALSGGAGPAIAAQAEQVRRDVQALQVGEPTRESIDWYRARAAEAARGGREALARAYLDEARLLGARRVDRYGTGELPVANAGADAGGARP